MTTGRRSPSARSEDPVTLALVQPARWHPDGHANLNQAHDAVQRLGGTGERHIVVLPELIGAELAEADYLEHLRRIATMAGAWVVGGSHHHRAGRSITNNGAVVAPDGHVAARYGKGNPFGPERGNGVQPARPGATVRIAGCDAAVLICADAWFAEHLLALDPPSPDLVIVTSFSITRREPDAARRLWHHLTVSRAYEFAAYVAVADWRAGTMLHGLRCAGAGGLAEPEPRRLGEYFEPAGDADIWVRPLDLDRLRAHRRDRASQGLLRADAPT